MGIKAEAVRQRIIDAADSLFYQRGFDNTSFTDIAGEVNISRGNFYYHFKSKDEILNAVIEARVDNIQTMLDEWQQNTPDPHDRIAHLIDIIAHNQDNIQQHGCPMGSLCNELSKVNHAMHADASKMLLLFRQWLVKQFKELGHKKKADELSMHLLSSTQGIATMMSNFPDDRFYKAELARLKQWLADL